MKNPFRFRHKNSTENAVITLIEAITDALKNNELVIAIFKYLKKAFDTIDHIIILPIILGKLCFYGIRE